MRILSNNCIGAFLYKDYGLPYATPLAMLQIAPKDFILFCKNIDYYLSCALESAEITKEVKAAWWQVGGGDINLKFPIGKLGGEIIIFFQHSKSFEEAKADWNRRLARYKNTSSEVYIILNLMGYARVFADKELSKNIFEEFLQIPHNKKILLHSNAQIATSYRDKAEIVFVGEIQNSWFRFAGENPLNRQNYHRFNFDKWLGFSAVRVNPSIPSSNKSSLMHSCSGGGGYLPDLSCSKIGLEACAS